MANKNKKSFFSPIIVLVSIGLVASFLLAVVFQVTDPIIAKREKEEKDAALLEVLKEGDSFAELTDVDKVEGVAKVHSAANGAGIVCETNCKSEQGGVITLMIGVDSLGQISGIKVISHNETAGIGDKVLQDSYFGNFISLKTPESVEAVDAIGGATKTSVCVKNSCIAAVEQYISMLAK